MEVSVAPKPVTGTNYVQESPGIGDPYKLCEAEARPPACDGPETGDHAAMALSRRSHGLATSSSACVRAAPKPVTGNKYVQQRPETVDPYKLCEPRP